MPTRSEAATNTRRRLIETGLGLTESTGLSGLSVNLIVAEAGVSKGTFFHHFGDRTSYLLALHREFHERVLDAVGEAIEGTEPGAQRLHTVAGTYLDVCLRNRGVRSLLLEARAERPVAEEVAARNASNAKLCEPDFRAMGWSHPLASARLWVGMTAEAALVELEAGRRNRAIRAALDQFIAEHPPRP
jgi:TetR/AcrR family transcriptional regulator, transcriptional repressor for nem operon